MKSKETKTKFDEDNVTRKKNIIKFDQTGKEDKREQAGRTGEKNLEN